VPVSLVALVPSAVVGNVSIPVNSSRSWSRRKRPSRHLPDRRQHADIASQCGASEHDGRDQFHHGPASWRDHQITILAGDIPLGMESITVSLLLWRDNKLKILGLVSAQRLSLAPEIPTIARPFPLRSRHLAEHRRARRHAARGGDQAARLDQVAMPGAQLAAAGIEPRAAIHPSSLPCRPQADVRAKVIQAVGIKID
jgi:hypothetical protein